MTDTIDPGIADIATYLPAGTLENDVVVERFGMSPEFLHDKIGIKKRHIAGADEAVSDMGIAAAEALFAKNDVAREDIGLLVVCTQNPDYRLPTTANLIQHRLGLPLYCAAFDINQGCSGYVYGLSITCAMMRANHIDTALFITTEAYSKVMDPSDRATVPLFGDGATATLLTAEGPGKFGCFTFGSDGGGAENLIVKGGGSRNPAMACSGEGALFMNGRAIFNFMLKRVPTDVDRCLKENGLARNDIDLFIFHQASKFMVNSLVSAMKLDPEKVPVAMSETGNTVSSTLPLVLDSLGGVAALRGKRLLLCGFGVGLSWASGIVTFT